MKQIKEIVKTIYPTRASFPDELFEVVRFIENMNAHTLSTIDNMDSFSEFIYIEDKDRQDIILDYLFEIAYLLELNEINLKKFDLEKVTKELYQEKIIAGVSKGISPTSGLFTDILMLIRLVQPTRNLINKGTLDDTCTDNQQ